MISERRFAEAFTSFWHQVLPRGAAVIRHVNYHLEAFDQPLESELDPSTRARVNETAFRVFVSVARQGMKRWSPPDAEDSARIWREVWEFLAPAPPGTESGPGPDPPLGELEESLALGRRLWSFFHEQEAGRPLLGSPEFRGCGMLDTVAGDVLAGGTLYEVKARGGRDNFHVVDLRQLVVYCALDRLDRRGRFEKIGLLNPRKGLFYREDAARVLAAASGTDADELLADVVEFLSREGASG